MNKKAMSVELMEFLMTYGWVILVVMVGIFAIIYFGVLNPEIWSVSKNSPTEEDYCLLNMAEKYCERYDCIVKNNSSLSYFSENRFVVQDLKEREVKVIRFLDSEIGECR